MKGTTMDDDYFGEFLFPGISVSDSLDDDDDAWLTQNDDDEDDYDDDDYFVDPNCPPDDDDGFVVLTAEDLSSCHEEWEDWI